MLRIKGNKFYIIVYKKFDILDFIFHTGMVRKIMIGHCNLDEHHISISEGSFVLL